MKTSLRPKGTLKKKNFFNSLLKYWKASGKNQEKIQKLLKTSIHYGKIENTLYDFYTDMEDFWIFGCFLRFPYSLENIQDGLDDFETVRYLSGQSGRFPDSLEDFEDSWKFAMGWRISRQFKIFQHILETISDSLEDFRTVWTIFQVLRRFPDSLEDFRTVLNISGQPGRFLNSLENFWTVWKISRWSRKCSGQSKRF